MGSLTVVVALMAVVEALGEFSLPDPSVMEGMGDETAVKKMLDDFVVSVSTCAPGESRAVQRSLV